MPQSSPNTNCFDRSKRILTPKAYKAAFNNASKLVGRYFVAYISASDSTDHKLGLVVSKKTAKQAVKRNRIKRIARESFRSNKVLNKTRDLPPISIVLVSRTSAKTAENSALFKELGWVFRKSLAMKRV